MQGISTVLGIVIAVAGIVLMFALFENAMKRLDIVKEYLSESEMTNLEKEIGRDVDWKIFDSNIHDWSRNKSTFYTEMRNKTNETILIETTEGIKFGMYFNNKITEMNKYSAESNAFIFKFNGNAIERYPIKDTRNAIKISDERSEVTLCRRAETGRFLARQNCPNYQSKNERIPGFGN